VAKLSHFDEAGQARMVDVGPKTATERRAVAVGMVHMQPETLELIVSKEAAKGDVLGVARTAGIIAAKRTSDLIPLCHPIRLTSLAVDFTPDPGGPSVSIRATVKANDRTGVEMEALVAVSVAALTIYDMCKSYDRAMRIDAIQLVEKSGGRSGHYRAPEL
jgi:cyclic pyranopterin phosphate synthase